MMQTQQWKEQGPLLAVPVAATGGTGISTRLVAECGVMHAPCSHNPDRPWPSAGTIYGCALINRPHRRCSRDTTNRPPGWPKTRRNAAAPNTKKVITSKALDAFNKAPGTDAAYNRGNALAKLGDYQQAIAAYDEALEVQPGMEDAAANKAAVEALLKEQQQQQSSRVNRTSRE